MPHVNALRVGNDVSGRSLARLHGAPGGDCGQEGKMVDSVIIKHNQTTCIQAVFDKHGVWLYVRSMGRLDTTRLSHVDIIKLTEASADYLRQDLSDALTRERCQDSEGCGIEEEQSHE